MCTYRFAYIRQEDLFFSQLTVRETLSLAAEMQLQDLSTVEERDEYIDNLLFKLGLVRQPESLYIFYFHKSTIWIWSLPDRVIGSLCNSSILQYPCLS